MVWLFKLWHTKFDFLQPIFRGGVDPLTSYPLATALEKWNEYTFIRDNLGVFHNFSPLLFQLTSRVKSLSDTHVEINEKKNKFGELVHRVRIVRNVHGSSPTCVHYFLSVQFTSHSALYQLALLYGHRPLADCDTQNKTAWMVQGSRKNRARDKNRSSRLQPGPHRSERPWRGMLSDKWWYSIHTGVIAQGRPRW